MKNMMQIPFQKLQCFSISKISSNNLTCNFSYQNFINPLHFSRMSDQVPFSKTSLLTSDSANRLQFRKPSHFNPAFKFERNHLSGEDITEEHELNQRNGSTDTSMRTTSSPNISNFSSSSGRRSTRKLMLRSIPSFPSLTQP